MLPSPGVMLPMHLSLRLNRPFAESLKDAGPHRCRVVMHVELVQQLYAVVQGGAPLLDAATASETNSLAALLLGAETAFHGVCVSGAQP